MDSDAAKLGFMVIVGFLAIEVGVTGKLGSLFGAIVDPANMQTGVTSGTNATATGSTLTAFTGSTANSTEISSMITAVFGPYASQAMKIANCESGLNTNAVNTTSVGGSYATGVFQILYPSTWNTTSYKNGNPKDARTNILAAYEIFRRDNYSWREWACASIVGL
jgi:hypothetical protein